MKKEVRLKDLLTVDPTDGSYAHDPLDIVVTAYKKRKRDWMISEEEPEMEESVYDTMSKYELNAELRRINAELDRLKKQDKTKQVQTSIDLLTNARDSVLEMLKEDVELTEALTPQQRMKRRQIMRSLKSRIKLGRQRASRRRASTEVLRARALRAARNELTKRMTGGKSKGELSFGTRARIEKSLAQKKTMIKSLAQRLLSQVRAKENARIKARTQQ
jgi:hypothetical protein